jgi:5-methylcytosine-specific restriction endonuclease McrA
VNSLSAKRLKPKKHSRCSGVPRSVRKFNRITNDRFQNHRKRARLANATIDYDLEYYRAIVKVEIGQPCPYCFQELTLKNHSADHQTPTARGGSYTKENLGICCRRCNQAKGILTLEEFESLLALTRTWPDSVRTNTLARLRAGSKLFIR